MSFTRKSTEKLDDLVIDKECIINNIFFLYFEIKTRS